MNSHLKKAFCILNIAFLALFPANAVLLAPDGETSTESLIDNIKSFIEINPDDPDALHALGQVYSFSYATGAKKFEVYSRSEPYWRPALGTANIPGSNPASTGEIPPERMEYLVHAIKCFHDAISNKSDDKYFWLSIAYSYKQAANHAIQMYWPFTGNPFDEEASTNTNNNGFWENLALDAYRKAFTLDTKPMFGFEMRSVAEQAGDGIVSILHQRDQLTDIEQKELRWLKRAVSAIQMQLIGGIGTSRIPSRPNDYLPGDNRDGKGTISGKVINNDTGKPVGGVTLQLLEEISEHIVPVGGLTPRFETITTRNGKFTFKKVPDGNWYVGVRDETMAPLSKDIAVSIDGKKKITDIEFNVRDGYSVEGRVYGDDYFAEGVPGLILEARTDYNRKEVSSRGFRTTTDVDGKFHLGGLPPGGYALFPAPQQPYVKCSMLFRNDRSIGDYITLKHGQHLTDIEFQVKPSYKVTGTVIDRNGVPVADAEVGFLWHNEYDPKSFNAITYTNREGRFTIISLEDEKGELSAHKDGLLATPTPYSAVSALEDKEDDHCTLKLVLPSRIRGQVVDKHGNPLPKASLHLWCYYPDSSTSKSLEMDSQGHFDTGDLFSGTCSFVVYDFYSNYGFESFHPDKFLLAEEEILEDYKIVLEDAVKKDEPDIQDSLTVSDNVTITDTIENVSKTDLPPKNFPMKKEMPIVPNEPKEPRTPGAFGTISGQVAVGGEPLSDVVVSKTTGTTPSCQTDAQGKYLLEYVNPGKCTISAAWKDSGIEQERYLYKKVDVIPDETTTVDFDFVPGTSGLKGILKVNGIPTSGSVFFRFYHQTGESEDLYLRTLQDGSYSFGYLPHGKAIVQFRCEKQVVGQTVTFVPNAIMELNCDIVPGTNISGSIKGANNPETERVWLLLGELTAAGFDQEPIAPVDPRRLTSSHIENGSFMLKNISPGVYTLVVVRRTTNTPRITSSHVLATKTIEVGQQDISSIELEIAAL